MLNWATIRLETKLQILIRTFDSNPYLCWQKLKSYPIEDVKVLIDYIVSELSEFEPEMVSSQTYAEYLEKTHLVKLGTPAFWVAADKAIRHYADIFATDHESIEINYFLDDAQNDSIENDNLVKFAMRCVSMRSKRHPLVFSE